MEEKRGKFARQKWNPPEQWQKLQNTQQHHLPRRSNTDFDTVLLSGLLTDFDLPPEFTLPFTGFVWAIGSMSIANGFLGIGFTCFTGLKTLWLPACPRRERSFFPRVTVNTGSEGKPGFDFGKLENPEDSNPCFVFGSADVAVSPRRLKTLLTFVSYK